MGATSIVVVVVLTQSKIDGRRDRCRYHIALLLHASQKAGEWTGMKRDVANQRARYLKASSCCPTNRGRVGEWYLLLVALNCVVTDGSHYCG